MAATTQSRGWEGPSRRRLPRFPLQGVLDVTVLRSGIPDTVPGRSINVCERGIAAVLAEELVPGEFVAIEMQLSPMTPPLQARAVVRYQDRLRSGLEFVGLSNEQRNAIRSWAKEAKEARVEPPVVEPPPAVVVAQSAVTGGEKLQSAGGEVPRRKRRRRFRIGWAIVFLMAGMAAAVSWWRWNREWDALESGLKKSEIVAGEKPTVQVSADVMQKLLIHRVEPAYPAEARKQRLQGLIALDIIVGRDGSVVNMRALNGPDVLARAAMEALRWWKFEPYRLNGEPVAVETTVAVEFKP